MAQSTSVAYPVASPVPPGLEGLSDEELARRMQQEEVNAANASHSSQQSHAASNSEVELRRLNRDIEANDAASMTLAAEIAALEARQSAADGSADVGLVGGEKLDFMRPKNYKPLVCTVVLVVCCGMMLLEIAKNDWALEPFSVNPTFGPKPQVLIDLGAKDVDLILKGEYHRFFTPIVLHAGIIHTAFNMFGLFNVGFPAEREFGHMKIGSIFLLSGFVGVLSSCLFVPEMIGVGASGAIFGLFGACWGDLIQNWSLYRGQAWKTFFQLFFSTAFNLILGLMPYLDNFAHIGGFVCGLIMGLTMLVQTRYSASGRRKGRKDYQVALQGLSIVALPMCIGIGLAMFFLKIDASEWCSACHYMSCVPMPPYGENKGNYWDCVCDGMVTGNVINNTAWFVACPRGPNITFPAGSVGDNPLQLDVRLACKELCLTDPRTKW